MRLLYGTTATKQYRHDVMTALDVYTDHYHEILYKSCTLTQFCQQVG